MKKILYLLLLLPLLLSGQTTGQNYVKTVTYRQGTTTEILSPAAAQAAVDVTYIDGLGRPIQHVAGKQSAAGKDIATPVVYDAFGRQTKEYLPVPVNTSNMAFTPTSTLIFSSPTSYYSAYGSDAAYLYSEKRLEASPLNRVLEQGAPGEAWVVNPAVDTDHTVKFDYLGNGEGEVRLLKAAATFVAGLGLYTTALVDNGYYPENSLYKTITKDEHWNDPMFQVNTTEEYKNQQGQVVLKRTYNLINNMQISHDTYYVYDQFGNLTYVVPPLVAGAISPVLDALCYQYKYDQRNRLVEKKLPGKQWEYIVYDKLDRVVATGPSNAPFNDLIEQEKIGWLITKYDALNRVVLTAWKQSLFTTVTRKALQDVYNGKTVMSEARSATEPKINGVAFRYTNLAEPTTGYHVLTINYYDDYNFTSATSWVPTVLPATSLGQAVYYTTATKPKGLATGSWIRIIGNSNEYLNERSYVLYDVKTRPILTFKRNHLLGADSNYTQYDFEGKIVQAQTVHRRLSGSPVLTVNDYFTYTDQGRPLLHTHKVNSLPLELMARNTYDDLGQLQSKKVGGTDATGTVGLQTVDYTYNIRGWLTGINNTVNLLKTGDPKDLFAFRIGYNKVEPSNDMGGTELFNGNISETYWRTASDDRLRKYIYGYDYLNRLRGALYMRPETAAAVGAYEENVRYDKNGNIKSMHRSGYLDSDSGETYDIDALTYTYKPNSNELIAVTDDTYSLDGFTDGVNPVDPTKPDYYYDANGNMITDWNKKIKSVLYNHLNLPVKIMFDALDKKKEITYVYNAVGQKIGKQLYSDVPGNVLDVKTEYLDGFQYLETALQFFPTAEGYVNVTGSNYNYVYNYTDHLGNVRLSYTKDPVSGLLKILEENHYYPFGMKHANYNNSHLDYIENPDGTGYADIAPVLANKFKYKYNGKEYQDELSLNWYDYGARNYDPALGRWMNIDPKAELYLSMSPYTYVANNPLRYIDPNGMEIINGETARREKLETLNAGQKANIDTKYKGNMEMSKKDFSTKGEYKAYKESVGNYKESSKALEKSIATEAKIQTAIDDFQATDPTNFNLANNLTFKDNKGNVQSIDINVNAGEASSFGGAVTKSGFDKNGNILSINTTLDFGDIKPVSNVLAHEAGHAYNTAQNPAKAMQDTTTHNCQDPANRNSFQSKTAMDWQQNYDRLKALQTKK